MLKLITPLAIAALTVLTIAPQAQAIPINLNSIYIGQQDGDTRIKAVIQIGTQPQYSNRWDVQRQREWNSRREREIERRRYKSYSRNDRHYSNDRDDYGRSR